MAVRCVDLFSGIGGFHATAHALGWNTVFACDVDPRNNALYERNWGLAPQGDIQQVASDEGVSVPAHDVLFAGFPCQPFSKSGAQRGMDEARGTLFWNIAKILEARRPRLVVLENVRNLWGPRHKHEWEVIIQTLRDLGYRVADEPLVTSPHRIPPSLGGRPQTRERIYINATYVPPSLRGRFSLTAPRLALDHHRSKWRPEQWDVISDLSERKLARNPEALVNTPDEKHWVDTWDELVRGLKSHDIRIPGIPLWADVWTQDLTCTADMPEWKKDFIRANQIFFETASLVIQPWLDRHPEFSQFPTSRRKLEWQAGELASLWECLLQFRPSGIRAKRPNYVPAAVAMTQTPLIGPLRRRLSVEELSHLQGLPTWFDFGEQPDSLSFRQLGNGISVASAFHSVLAHLDRDKQLLARMSRRDLLAPLANSTRNPDRLLRKKPSRH
ncbi:MAG: DNA (cytosine-5-)-methyltransferase [Pontimonas sp.]|nr:DNA (cytosine-5-)-methyltransferase [Pontimonas sp.]